ncbi:MAG TPA: N4-gp56 family major capsid protein [Porticoccaceae bacterium]|nr:N4-gp56 family major capsid protein [Porticoccaceae bacterium]
MATTSYGVNDSEAVKLWSKKLFREALNNTTMAADIGSGSGSIIQLMDDTSKGAGDRIRTILRMQLSGEGIQGDSTLEGQEEALITYTDDVVINQLRHAVRSKGNMSEQRIPFSVRNEARIGLQDWWADRFDTSIINQLSGNTAQTDTRYTGNQAVTATDSNHEFRPNSKSSDATLSAADTMSLTLIDSLVEKAETLSVPIRPVMVGGQPHYVLYMHPSQVTSVRTSTDTGQWLDIQKAAMQGGRVSDNPIFTGALGVYNGVVLKKNNRIPLGVNGTSTVANTRRAIFAGAQSACIAFGRDHGPNQMTWVEELFDFQNQLGVSAGSVFGVKRTIFNSESFGCIVLPTYATAA